jgi:hypothetical protein
MLVASRSHSMSRALRRDGIPSDRVERVDRVERAYDAVFGRMRKATATLT